MESIKNLTALTNYCKENETYVNKIGRLYEFMISTYPLIDEDILKLFPKENIVSLGQQEIKKDYLYNVFEILLDKYDLTMFERNFDEKEDKWLNNLLIVIHNYLSNKVKYDDIKYSLYITQFNINIENFFGLTFISTVAIIEMYNKSVDLSILNNKGNYYIEFVKDAVNSTFDSPNVAKIRGVIAETIDECLKEHDDLEIEFENGSFLFEYSNDSVSIFDYNRFDKPIAIVNSENEFLFGNYNDLLKYCKKEEFVDNKPSGIDNIIRMYYE